MEKEPQTLAEYQVAYKELKAKVADLENKMADAEEIIRRLQASKSKPVDKPKPGITRVDFSKM